MVYVLYTPMNQLTLVRFSVELFLEVNLSIFLLRRKYNQCIAGYWHSMLLYWCRSSLGYEKWNCLCRSPFLPHDHWSFAVSELQLCSGHAALCWFQTSLPLAALPHDHRSLPPVSKLSLYHTSFPLAVQVAALMVISLHNLSCMQKYHHQIGKAASDKLV